MKKILVLMVVTTLLFCTGAGCSEDAVINVNTENKESLNNTVFGKSALIKIGDCLYYDSTTGIVYWWGGRLSKFSAEYNTTPSPYYAPNGLPYRYNTETNTFEMIESEENYVN